MAGEWSPEHHVRWHGRLESRNVAMWFDETGEYWVVHGTVIAPWKYEKSALIVQRLMAGWEQALRA